MSTEIEIDGVRAALDAVPIAVVLIPAQGGPLWANRTARALAASDENIGESRLFMAVTSSAPVRAALESGKPSEGVVELPTDLGLVERMVVATPMPGSGRSVVASFIPPDASQQAQEKELRQRLETMLEHTSEMITVLDRNGTIRFSNAAAGRLTGFSGTAVNGQPAFDLVHPDDIDRVSIALAQAIAQRGPSPRVELRVRFADDQFHHVEATVNNLLGVHGIDALIVSMRDVTERKAAETMREALLANLSDVIVVLNERYEVTYASDSISRVIEAPPETNLGMSAFNDIHPDDLPNAIEALDKVSAAPTGSVIRVEIRLESRPGSDRWRWMEATAVNLLADPAVNGLVVTLHDVTEQKEAAQQLQSAYDLERAHVERLSELDRLKDDFLATVSHELRTPLAAIVGFADLIRDGGLEPDLQADLLRRIAASAADMRSMIDNVLDFSALDAGSVSLDLRPIALQAALDSVITSVAHRLTAHDVIVEVGDAVVIADEHGLGHVLRNLVTNAAKYSNAGTTITVRAGHDGDQVVLTVSDEGVGIPPDDLDKIFERFYRVGTASFVARGSGIGLNIASRYASLMGGAISVRSEVGVGSTFTLVLPAA